MCPTAATYKAPIAAVGHIRRIGQEVRDPHAAAQKAHAKQVSDAVEHHIKQASEHLAAHLAAKQKGDHKGAEFHAKKLKHHQSEALRVHKAPARAQIGSTARVIRAVGGTAREVGRTAGAATRAGLAVGRGVSAVVGTGMGAAHWLGKHVYKALQNRKNKAAAFAEEDFSEMCGQVRKYEDECSKAEGRAAHEWSDNLIRKYIEKYASVMKAPAPGSSQTSMTYHRPGSPTTTMHQAPKPAVTQHKTAGTSVPSAGRKFSDANHGLSKPLVPKATGRPSARVDVTPAPAETPTHGLKKPLVSKKGSARVDVPTKFSARNSGFAFSERLKRFPRITAQHFTRFGEQPIMRFASGGTTIRTTKGGYEVYKSASGELRYRKPKKSAGHETPDSPPPEASRRGILKRAMAATGRGIGKAAKGAGRYVAKKVVNHPIVTNTRAAIKEHKSGNRKGTVKHALKTAAHVANTTAGGWLGVPGVNTHLYSKLHKSYGKGLRGHVAGTLGMLAHAGLTAGAAAGGATLGAAGGPAGAIAGGLGAGFAGSALATHAVDAVAHPSKTLAKITGLIGGKKAGREAYRMARTISGGIKSDIADAIDEHLNRHSLATPDRETTSRVDRNIAKNLNQAQLGRNLAKKVYNKHFASRGGLVAAHSEKARWLKDISAVVNQLSGVSRFSENDVERGLHRGMRMLAAA